MTLSELRDRTPAGYNLAALVPVGWSWDLDDFAQRALPVLQEAEGIVGVLRALDLPGRMPGIMKKLAEDGKEARLVHLRLFRQPQILDGGGLSSVVKPDSAGLVRDWTFSLTLNPEESR